MFIIDFDDTLFDTQTFHQARREAIARIGVSVDLWNKTYNQARANENGQMVYHDVVHADILAQHNFSRDEILATLQPITQNCEQFLFPDAQNFLFGLKQCGQPLILLSLGDSDFQEVKVRACGIHDYFDRVFMIPDSKVRVINELAGATDVSGWLINDKIMETQEIVAAHPNIRPVMKMSPKFSTVEYEASGFPFFNDLNGIAKYIKNNSEHISAGAVIYKKNKSGVDILIMYRANTDTYHLPKGTLEFGETIEQTVEREIKEETNVSIFREEYLGTVNSSYIRDGEIKQKKTHYFLAQYESGKPYSTDGEHDVVEFVPLEKALSLLMKKGAHLALGFENEYEILQLAAKKLTV